MATLSCPECGCLVLCVSLLGSLKMLGLPSPPRSRLMAVEEELKKDHAEMQAVIDAKQK